MTIPAQELANIKQLTAHTLNHKLSQSVRQAVCLSASLSVCQFISLSSYQSSRRVIPSASLPCRLRLPLQLFLARCARCWHKYSMADCVNKKAPRSLVVNTLQSFAIGYMCMQWVKCMHKSRILVNLEYW